jgi:hypothetical protein
LQWYTMPFSQHAGQAKSEPNAAKATQLASNYRKPSSLTAEI